MDKDPKTKGAAFLRVYNLRTGLLEQEVNLAPLAPNAKAYFANDVAVDTDGNSYVSDWYAGLVYKVTPKGKAEVFWKNNTDVIGGPNGLDITDDGRLLISVISTNPPYKQYALVNIPLNDASKATAVKIEGDAFSGFDGMYIKKNGNIVGVSNDKKNFGGNLLLELSSNDNYKTAKVIHAKSIKASTTVAVTPENENFIIKQDFSNPFAKEWHIDKITF